MQPAPLPYRCTAISRRMPSSLVGGLNTAPTNQLALAICAELFDPEFAVRAAQAVKHRFLVFADYNADLQLDAAEITAFVEGRFAEIPA